MQLKPMDVFGALADPTRKQIVELLAGREIAAGDLARRFSVSAPAVSQHLRALRGAGLVRVRIDAQRRMYSLDPAGFDDIARWVDNMRSFWLPRLDALTAALSEQDSLAKPVRVAARRKSK